MFFHGFVEITSKLTIFLNSLIICTKTLEMVKKFQSIKNSILINAAETQPPEVYTSDYEPSSECSGIFLNDKGKEKEKPCIFPFKYNGNTYNECTTVDSPNGQPRCARRVTKKGKILNDKWAYCNPGCPGYGY